MASFSTTRGTRPGFSTRDDPALTDDPALPNDPAPAGEFEPRGRHRAPRGDFSPPPGDVAPSEDFFTPSAGAASVGQFPAAEDLTIPGGAALGGFLPFGGSMSGDEFSAPDDPMVSDDAAPRSDFSLPSRGDPTPNSVDTFGIRGIDTLAGDDDTELLDAVVLPDDVALGADVAHGELAADENSAHDTPSGTSHAGDQSRHGAGRGEASGRRITVAGRSFAVRSVAITVGALGAVVVASTIFALSGRHSADASTSVDTQSVDQPATVPGAPVPGVAIPGIPQQIPPLPAVPPPPPSAPQLDGPPPPDQLPGGPPMHYPAPPSDPSLGGPQDDDPQLGGPQPDPSLDGNPSAGPNGQLPPSDPAGQPGTPTPRQPGPESLSKRLGSLGDPSDDPNSNDSNGNDAGSNRKGLGGALGGLGGGPLG
jgi:hypothetical protein